MSRCTPASVLSLLILAAAAAPALRAQPTAPPPPRNAQAGQRGELGLTVYSSADPAGFDPQQFIAQQRRGYRPDFASQVPGFGVVREVRELQFGQGLGTVRFSDVARFIDPTTVSFTDLANPGATAVLEQQFLFDLVSPEKLLDEYIDREITVRIPIGEGQMQAITGTLLSNNQGRLVLQTEDGLRIINRDEAQVQLGELPGGLITEPTLQWLVDSREAGRRPVRVTYQTDGLTWRADYNLILNEDDAEADLSAWVTLMNISGMSYPNAKLKLIAGDVRRVEPDPRVMRRYAAMEAQAAGADRGFEEQAFYEYHLYTLPRRTDVPQNTTQQIALFPTKTGVGVEKVMVYYGLPEDYGRSFLPNPRTDRNLGIQSNTEVDVYIRFQNTEENELGVPLPAGKVRVYKENPDDATIEFVGEDVIDHTPRGEEVLVKTGQAFDVVGERKRTDFQIDVAARRIIESFEIELRNHKDEPVNVIVKENLYRWSNWEIIEQSDEFEKIDARTIHFDVRVPPRGSKTVTYTVRYTW